MLPIVRHYYYYTLINWCDCFCKLLHSLHRIWIAISAITNLMILDCVFSKYVCLIYLFLRNRPGCVGELKLAAILVTCTLGGTGWEMYTNLLLVFVICISYHMHMIKELLTCYPLTHSLIYLRTLSLCVYISQQLLKYSNTMANPAQVFACICEYMWLNGWSLCLPDKIFRFCLIALREYSPSRVHVAFRTCVYIECKNVNNIWYIPWNMPRYRASLHFVIIWCCFIHILNQQFLV